MQAKALKTFLHDQLGRVEKGTEFEATAAQLSGVRAFVEVYETKVIDEQPVMPKRRIKNEIPQKTR
jgi:hypothetical protein